MMGITIRLIILILLLSFFSWILLSRPFTRILPELGLKRVAIILSVVVFPAPLIPSSPYAPFSIVRFTFLKNRFQPYVKVGGQVGYLLSVETESKLERLDPETGEIINPSETIKRDHSDYRERLNYYIGGGLGLRMNFNKFYLFAEADYYHPLNNMLASDQNRFEQSNLWSEAWVDSDFRIIHSSFRVGIARSLYSIKKIR